MSHPPHPRPCSQDPIQGCPAPAAAPADMTAHRLAAFSMRWLHSLEGRPNQVQCIIINSIITISINWQRSVEPESTHDSLCF
jgi:hypothetical protein